MGGRHARAGQASRPSRSERTGDAPWQQAPDLPFQDLALALEVSPLFRVKPARAKSIVAAVVTAVRGWRAEANAAGFSRAAQDQMTRAFRIADAAVSDRGP